MTIEEAIEKIENVEPVNISSMYGEDIISYLDIDSCDDCHNVFAISLVVQNYENFGNCPKKN